MTEEDPTCIEYSCLANPEHPDARYARETYGLSQITSDETREAAPRMDDGLLIWQSFREQPNSDIFAYDMQSAELISVAVSDDYLASRAFVSHGRVVHSQKPFGSEAPDAGRPSYLVLWTRETGTSRVLDTGLNGTLDSFGFDGQWVIFTNRNDPHSSRNGVYAYQVDDGRLVHLYTPIYEHADGMRENVQTFAIDDAKAYFVMQRFYPDDANTTERMALIEGEYGEHTIYEIQLETGATRVAYRGGVPIAIMDVSGHWLAASSDLRMRILDLTANQPEFVEVSTDRTGFFGLNDGWLVFAEGRLPDTTTAIAYHLLSSTRHVIATDDQGGVGRNEVGFFDLATDGSHVVFALHRTYGENFSKLGDDLYSFDLNRLRGDA